MFAAHILRADQLDVVVRLGMASGRDGDKLGSLDAATAPTGAPVLSDCYAWFDCRVVNAMDTGASTVFLGAAEAAGGTGAGEVMTSDHVRSGVPVGNKAQYDADVEAAQRFSTEMLDHMRALVWRGLRAGGG